MLLDPRWQPPGSVWALDRFDAALREHAEAENYLMNHLWPGNVRELDNVINRAAILAENHCITVADLPAGRPVAARPNSCWPPQCRCCC